MSQLSLIHVFRCQNTKIPDIEESVYSLCCRWLKELLHALRHCYDKFPDLSGGLLLGAPVHLAYMMLQDERLIAALPENPRPWLVEMWKIVSSDTSLMLLPATLATV